MKKYDWDNDILRKKRNKLLVLANNVEDLNKKQELYKVIAFLDNYHFINLSGANPPKQDLYSKIYYTASERTGYFPAYHLVTDFYSKILPLKDKFDLVHDKLNQKLGDAKDFSTITGTRISNKKAFYLLNKFYQSFNPTLYSEFEKIYNTRFDHFRFTSDNTGNDSNQISDGFCIYLGELNENYISINKDNTISKVINLIHECGHGVANLVNGKKCYCEKESFFAEIESIFPEMVSLYTNPFNFPQVEVNHLLYCILYTYFEAANYICMHDLIIDSWEDNNFKTGINFKKQLYNKYGIRNIDLLNALNHSITDSGCYVLSYSACCELLYIYKQDKEKALEIYNKLLRINPDLNEIYQVSSLLDLNKHSNEISNEIVDRMILSMRKLG